MSMFERISISGLSHDRLLLCMSSRHIYYTSSYQEFFFLVWKVKQVFLLSPEFVSDFSVFCMLLKGEEEKPPLGEGLAPLFCNVSL